MYLTVTSQSECSVLLLVTFQQRDQIERYVPRYLIFCILWAFSGDCKLKTREDLGQFIRSITTVPLPSSATSSIVDFEVCKAVKNTLFVTLL